MFEIVENNKKDVVVIENEMLKNATIQINKFQKIAKNSILAISLILADICEYPSRYFENSAYSTIAEYAESLFGYKKAYTYKLIKISKFISIKSIEGDDISVKDLIDDSINKDYFIDVLKDNDGFEFSPSQMLELIPLSSDQIQHHINELDSSLTCKELRSIVKDIISPPIETTGESKESTEESTEENQESTPEVQMTDKDRLLQMLEICSTLENEDIKSKIVNVFQKALKALEK